MKISATKLLSIALTPSDKVEDASVKERISDAPDWNEIRRFFERRVMTTYTAGYPV